MTSEKEGDSGPALDSGPRRRGARFVLLACCATHLVTDGLVNALFPLLPLIALDLQLSYAAVGALRTAVRSSSSLLQLPVGFLAEWLPETALLGAGMLWMSLGFAAMAAATGFGQLLLLMFGAGIGGSAQHPIGTAIVSKLYDSGRRGAAVSSLNFSGDLGKVLFPALGGVVALTFGWRGAMLALGVLGVVVSAGYALSVRELAGATRPARPAGEEANGWGIRKPGSFALLSVVGVIDDSTRVGVLTFLPFLAMEKGLDAAQSGFLLTLIFACGAAGKLGCGFLADRFGNVGVIVITEAITALAILAVIPVDPLLLIPILVAFGFVLNGTSSALYMSVAEMVHVEKRARGYGLFYTFTLGGATLAPLLYGALADLVGVSGAFVAMAILTLATLPMAVWMGRR